MQNDGPSVTTRKIKSEGRSITGAPFFISPRGVVSSIHAAAKEHMLTSSPSRGAPPVQISATSKNRYASP